MNASPPAPSREPNPTAVLLRRYGTTVYAPAFLISAGVGAVIPATPLLAGELGGGLAVAGLAVAMRSGGTMAMDVPAGLLVARLGDRRLMILGAALTGLLALAASATDRLPAWLALVFASGAALGLFSMTRMHFMAVQIEAPVRGRAMAMLGGMGRFGVFVGPILGGLVADRAGLHAAFAVQAVLSFAAALLLLRLPRPARPTPDDPGRTKPPPVAATLRSHAAGLGGAGLVALGLQVVRQARHLLLPLWGDAIGLDVAEIGLVVGLSSGLDMLFFHPAGVLMDRFGRRASGVPSLLLFATGLAALPLVTGFAGLMAVGLVIGFGNGLSAGFVMTLGADLAPEGNRGPFLGVWRLIADTGSAGGPLVVGAAAQATSLGVAAFGAAGLGLAAALVLVAWVGETLRN